MKDRFRNLVLWLVRLLVPGVNMFQKSRVTVYSGYATLFIVTAMIPFIVLIISIVRLIPGYSAEDVSGILLQILPDLESIDHLVIALITRLTEQVGGLLASVAAVTTLWSASKGVMAIQKGLNELDRVDESRDPFETDSGGITEKGFAYVYGVLRRLIATVTLIILIPTLLILKMVGDSVARKIGAFVLLLIAFLMVLLFYAKLPKIHRTLKSQFPGAILTVLCWLVFTELFSFFVSRSYRYSHLVGSLAALFLLVMWIRYMVMIFFGGGVLNRVLPAAAARGHADRRKR